MAQTLSDLLAAAVAADSDAAAILHGDERLSFADLDRRSRAFAVQLQRADIEPGARMLLCLQNVPAFVVALLGAARAGVVTVPVNPMYRGAELARLAADCTPAAIVCEADHAEAPAGIVRFTADACGGRAAGEDDPAWRDRPGDPLMLVYTSGTTGKPKGAVIDHANLLAGAEFYRAAALLQPGDPILAAAPLFHVTGLSGHIGAALAARAPLVLCGRFQAGPVLAAIERHRPVFTVAAITALAALIDSPEFSTERVRSLRTIFSGGAPVAPAMRERVRQATGVTLRNVYGLTETVAPVVAVPAEAVAPVDPGSGALSIGQPVPGTTIRIIDEDGRDLPSGEPGEISVSGPSVVAGYWQAEDATAEAMRVDGFRTGDVGVRDVDGWLYLVDRKKDMIVASGFKVWPREVEDTLLAFPAIREAAVVGVADAYRGETVKAVVSLRDGAELDRTALEAFCRGRLAAYKVPRIVEVTDELPKTATGKILRRDLRG